MTPEWGCPVSLHLEEENWLDRVKRLYKMFAEKKVAGREIWTSAHPISGVGSVFWVQRKADW
jgi:hypothetical protein